MENKKTPPTPLPFRILNVGFPILENLLPFVAKSIVVRLFFTPFRFSPREEENRMQSTGKEYSITVNNQKVIIHSWGKGPVAVLVHGWSGRGMQLRKFINPLLNKGYQVISFDAPGHGKSEGKQSTLIEFSDTIKKISEEFGSIQIAIGHSLGGAALMYAAKDQVEIGRLITVSTPTLPKQIVKEFLRRVNGSSKMAPAIDNYVLKRTGNHFEYYSGEYNLPYLSKLPLLSFHDHNDKEAGIEHLHAIKQLHPNSKTIETNNLGHNRILKDDKVIDQAMDFVPNA